MTVYYAGYLANGQLFDSRSSPSSPFSVQLGPNANVIKGWNEGVVGMKVGGVRQLIIPPELAYGAFGSSRHPAQRGARVHRRAGERAVALAAEPVSGYIIGRAGR